MDAIVVQDSDPTPPPAVIVETPAPDPTPAPILGAVIDQAERLTRAEECIKKLEENILTLATLEQLLAVQSDLASAKAEMAAAIAAAAIEEKPADGVTEVVPDPIPVSEEKPRRERHPALKLFLGASV